MKRGYFVLIGLVSMVLFCAPLFGQQISRGYETYNIDTFDPSGEQQRLTWSVNPSRFIAEGFPKINYFNGEPNSLRLSRLSGLAYRPSAESDTQRQVLGIQVGYRRKADNWFEVFPVNEDNSHYEFPLEGIVSQIDFWVWGTDYHYSLELMIRDTEGLVHVLPVGSLYFQGWKNFIVPIPSNIRQRSRKVTAAPGLAFLGFRVRAKPTEYADKFTVYFDQLKYTTAILDTIYDGYELRNENFDAQQGAAQ
ncbi:MAG: flagellar filament outer layer protein FlaA [Treponema sp.]|jgi:hypothetical protein|nr:flagellar filament outer layer protein FlaA [Treponema sp.]